MKWILLPLAAFVVCSCTGATQHSPLRLPAHRIVSLMPSLTEDLCAIGARDRLAGVSVFSNDIPCARDVPSVATASTIDTERIVLLHADVVAGIPAQRTMMEPLTRARIPIVTLSDDSYADIFSDISALGKISGREREAQHLIDALRARTKALQNSEHFRKRPKVFVVVQAQPIWTVGPQSYIATLIDLAGGTNAVRSLPRAYAQYSAEALLRLQPDAIVAMNESGLTSLLSREPWRSLSAVREGRVYVLSDDAILVRPGPRYTEGLAWLIRHLRPIAT